MTRKRYTGVRPSKRNTIFVRDKFACRYCRTRPPIEELTVDHVVPRARGGSDRNDNLVACCMVCNQKKANDIWEPLPIPDGTLTHNPLADLLIAKGFADA